MTINPHAYNFLYNHTVLLIGTSLDQTSNDSGRQNCAITYQEDTLKKRPLIGLATFLIAFITFSSYFQRWRRQTMTRVRTESSLAVTALGPIEYQSQGEGPALLVVHGSPGGYDHGIALAKLLS